MKSIVIGAGGWGTAIAVMLHKAGTPVTLWSFETETKTEMDSFHTNSKYLPGVTLPEGIAVTCNLADASDKDLIVIAVPSFAERQTVQALRPFVQPSALLVSATKGLEQQSHKRMSEILREELPNPIVVLSGPSHAEEVGRCIPTTVVAAGEPRYTEQVQEAMMNDVFRIYSSTDVAGVELGGALKNAIALAAGICDGCGLGDNTKAALMSRGMVEMTRLGVALGAQAETFAGLSGMGDLIVTCTSMHSRNRRAGILIGQGIPSDEAIAQIGTVEGFHTAAAAYELAKSCGVEMPIVEQMYHILFEHASVGEAVKALMSRPKKLEQEPAL